jgi:hypothetical protein
VTLAAVLAASAAHTSAPLVPMGVQHAIANRAPALAYVPARIAVGYRYAAWRYADGRVSLRFLNRAGQEILFSVAKQRGPCREGREKTFQMAGNKVYWSHTTAEQQAWRCVDGVQLIAATPQAPTKFADVGLGTLVASGHRIRLG